MQGNQPLKSSLMFNFSTIVLLLALPLIWSAASEAWHKRKDIETIDAEIKGVVELRQVISEVKMVEDFNVELRTKISELGDDSGLILDPRKDTYYWVDTVINFFPEFMSTKQIEKVSVLKRQKHAFEQIYIACGEASCSYDTVEANMMVERLRDDKFAREEFTTEKEMWLRSANRLQTLLENYRKEMLKNLVFGLVVLLTLVLVAGFYSFRSYKQIILTEHQLRGLIEELKSEKDSAIHSARLATVGTLAAEIMHEVKSPLALISGMVVLLRKSISDSDKYLDKFSKIENAIQRIEKIVNSFRTMSRVKNKSELAVCDLTEVVKDSVQMIEFHLKHHAVPIELDIDSKQLITINCDKIEIEQVVINLVKNAIDEISKAEVSWIKLRLFIDRGWAVLQVIDSGTGLTVEIEKKLFQPFFTTKSAQEGTGLGLSIVQNIITGHNGTIQINREFKTTCFEIRIPHVQIDGLKNAA